MSNPENVNKNNNVASFLTSLALNGGLLVLQVGIFVFLKSYLTRIYSPRSYLPPPERRAEELAPGLWKWLPQTFITPSSSIIRKNGLDAYMSIRFFEMMMKIFAVFTLVTWPILLPINAAGMPPNQDDGLARFSFGNINRNSQPRYWAHLIVAYGLTGFVLWLIRRELLIFVHLRHQFLISKYHSKLAQAKTVLITSLPQELCDEAALRQLFSFVPGGINHIWVYRNEPTLPDLYEERQELCDMLEKASTTLLQTAIKARIQQEKKTAKAKHQAEKGKGRKFPLGVTANADDEAFAGDLEKIGAEKLLDNLHRPMHRPGWIPFWGVKVDTIDYCINRLGELNEKITAARKLLPECKPFGSCFIQCNLQIGAHVIAQCVSYHEPLFMSQRWIEVAPEDVVWRNIDDGHYEVRTRYVLSWAATFGLLILWGFPVALAGFTSNAGYACSNFWWLAWICKTSDIAQGFITGVFPPVLLAVLFLILPYLLKALAWFENTPRWSLISINVYKRYFAFLVVHGFLIITFFSALSSILRDLQNPTGLVRDFSIYLPNASTFFLTYMLQQGLMGAAGALLQVGPLIIYFVKKLFFGNTPREAFEATFLMPSFDFGIMLPRMSLLATIGFAYAIVSPIINVLALATFALFWLSWKFLLIWVLDQPDAQETSGLYFPLLMSNLFTGLYLQEICLMGLFFFAENENGDHTTIPQGVLMAVLIVITAMAHIFFNHSFQPVIDFLPMSLSTKRLAERFHKNPNRAASTGGQGTAENPGGQPAGNAAADEIDLFSRERVRSVVRHKLRLRHTSTHQRGTSYDVLLEKKDKEEALRVEEEEKKRKASDKAKATADELIQEKGPGDANVTISETPPPVDPSASKASLHSKSSKKVTTSKLMGALASAQPDAIKIDAPAKALVDKDGDGEVDSDTDDDLEEHAFDHPSTYMDQRWIWVPKWEAHPELSAELVREIKEHNVDAADIGAIIDEGGNVTVTRGPPDEDWSGGHDR